MSTKSLRKPYTIKTSLFPVALPANSVLNRLFFAASSCRRFSLQVAPPQQTAWPAQRSNAVPQRSPK
jgi:hypothetical protein